VRRVALVLVTLLFLVIAANVLIFSLPGPFHEGHGRLGKFPGFFVLVVLVVIVFAGVRYIRQLASPVGEVIEAADRVARGDYTVRVKPRGTPELQSLVASFNQMTERLESNEEQRRRLLADVTHELRTPLSVIRGNAEGLLDGLYVADEQSLGPILQETETMARLLDDLQTLALADSARLELYREPVRPPELVDSVVAAFAAQAEEKGVNLRAVRSEVGSGPPEIDLDPVRIRQVLENLLANALRYTPAGGTVTVSVGPAAGSATNGSAPAGVTFSVADTGPGIPPQELERVFERFAKSADSGGSGLGLAIARTIVQAHGGTITANNAAGGGAVFSFTLPAT
jgi:signal transduction histidine kinase